MCEHTNTKTSKPYVYRGSVGRGDEPRAAGGICILETCEDCGSQREVNSNGMFEEEGYWGQNKSDAVRDARAEYNTVYHDTKIALVFGGRKLSVQIEKDGMLLVTGEHTSEDVKNIPKWFIERAVRVRRAVVALEGLGAKP